MGDSEWDPVARDRSGIQTWHGEEFRRDPMVVLHGIPHCARVGSECVHVKYFCCCSVVNAMKF